jgi:hypothetical protein
MCFWVNILAFAELTYGAQTQKSRREGACIKYLNGSARRKLFYAYLFNSLALANQLLDESMPNCYGLIAYWAFSYRAHLNSENVLVAAYQWFIGQESLQASVVDHV